MAFQKQHLIIGICLLLLHHTIVAVGAAAAATTSAKAIDTKATVKEITKHENNKKAEFPAEDADMLMEPNDFTPVTVLRSQEQQFHSPPTYHFHPISPNPHIAARSDIEPTIPHPTPIDSHSQAAQNYYPPFFREAPPLGHSRPYFPIPDSPVIPKYAPPHSEEVVPLGPTQRNFDPTILGSGDFGVLRGGTFYPEEEMPFHTDENSDFNQYYGDANGHGRPSNEEFVQKYTYPEEQFADFRDFADINTPADSAFSQFVVVYAAKNSTQPITHPRPKNIFEQLELLDREKEQEEREEKKRRASKSKSKLAKTKLQKKYKKKTSTKDMDYEPLLALS